SYGIKRPLPTLTIDSGDRIRGHASDEGMRHIKGMPAPGVEFVGGGEILDQVPRGKATEFLKSLAAIEHTAATGDGRIGVITAGQERAIEDRIAAEERVALRHNELLTRLDERHALELHIAGEHLHDVRLGHVIGIQDKDTVTVRACQPEVQI